jgi:hypothetical protein
MRKNHELKDGDAFGTYTLRQRLESYDDEGELLRGDEPWSPFDIHEINCTENMRQFELNQFGRTL